MKEIMKNIKIRDLGQAVCGPEFETGTHTILVLTTTPQ
jgi:hypothetical protein